MRTAAVIFGLCLVAPALQAQEVNDRCLLQEPTKLFMGKDGERLMTELEAKTIVILKVSHSLRWRVATERGRLGFIDKLWLNKFCTLSKSEAAPSPSPRPKTPSTNATHEIAMVAANLELSAAKAMRSSSSSSTSKVESDTKASSSAGAAREIQCIESRQSALIRVAVYDFKLGNLSKSLGRLMTNSVLDEIRKLEGVSAIGMDEIREMLSFEAQRQTLGCEADEACLAEIGGALGVDELIFGSISDAEHGRTLSIRRIAQMRAEVVQVLSDRAYRKGLPALMRRLEVEDDAFVREAILRAIERLEE